MNELFLFVRPPRPLWPFNSPSSAFWPPLAFASMAAMLRERLPDLRVEILDAPVLEMGWRTLTAELQRRGPAYVGIGEEAVSCVEGLRLARLAKAQGAKVIAGGCFFGHVAPQALATALLDVVVHGEGELTVVELVQALREGSRAALAQVHGISFLAEEPRRLPVAESVLTPALSAGEVITTAPRQLVSDLDTLPFPAYDLLPVERYGARSLNHPRLAAIELGRGCFGSRDFCVLWRQMGRFAGDRLLPQLRVKSPERLREEIRLLVRRYHRQYLSWVDPCFNADPRVPGQLAELLLRDGIRVGQSAWMRTDAMVRDAHSGALANCVRSGLNEVYLGIERPDSESIAALHKTSGAADAREALRILREQFPEVLAIGSFIYGLPGNIADAVNGCWQCHGTIIKFKRDAKGDIVREGKENKPMIAADTWPNSGIGRLNPDGSKGSCNACHSRHSFEAKLARAGELRQMPHGHRPSADRDLQRIQTRHRLSRQLRQDGPGQGLLDTGQGLLRRPFT